MNADSSNCFSGDLDPWQDGRTLRSLVKLAPVMPLSTLAGCAAFVVCLWPVTPHARLGTWLTAGLLLIGAQWMSWRILDIDRTQAASQRDIRACRCWFVASALSTGLFWGAASIALFPEGSPVHQILLACVLAAVSALWLPSFALERITLPALGVPALLPMAFNMLSSPAAPLTTMGSLLLLLFAAFLIVAHVTRRVFDADYATQRALYHRATHDPLVDLANHAEFHRCMQALDAAPSGPYAVVCIDLDHFKLVNDTAGHAVGDRVLQQVSAVVRREIRKADIGARIGGDEFAVLMQLCTDQEALRVARAILESIGRLQWGPAGAAASVTASIGIACSAEVGTSTPSVLEAADRACYAAKASGRNRIEIAITLAAYEDLPFPSASASASSRPGPAGLRRQCLAPRCGPSDRASESAGAACRVAPQL